MKIVNQTEWQLFPFGDEVFLSSAPMTDKEFAEYVEHEDEDISIEDVYPILD